MALRVYIVCKESLLADTRWGSAWAELLIVIFVLVVLGMSASPRGNESSYTRDAGVLVVLGMSASPRGNESSYTRDAGRAITCTYSGSSPVLLYMTKHPRHLA